MRRPARTGTPGPAMRSKLVRERQRSDGRWNLGPKHPGQSWLTMEAGGRPSVTITLGAMRVLRWWDGSTTG